MVSGVDKYKPVDVYIPGCPPTPQSLLNGLIALQKKIDKESLKDVRWYQKESRGDLPVPVLGPDLMDPAKYAKIKQFSQSVVEENAPVGEELSDGGAA